MIPYPASLLAVGGARTGIAPVNLLDIQDVNGNVYFWADRKIVAPTAILVPVEEADAAGVAPPVPIPAGEQLTWAIPQTATFAMYGNRLGSASGSGSSGLLSCTGGASQSMGTWSNFRMPPLPAGAVIQSVYLVLQATGIEDGNVSHVAVSTTPAMGVPANGNFSSEYYSELATATAAAIAAATLQASILDETEGDATYQELDVTFVGIAIYYTAPAQQVNGLAQYSPWLLSVPRITFNRSLITDVGVFVIQNLSGDSLSRDFEKQWRLSALEGAMFVYRCWQPDAQAAWIEVHGTLTVTPTGADTAQLKGKQLLDGSQVDAPPETLCETCQLNWGSRRCGSGEATECSYSFQTCQVVERPLLVLNNYEKNNTEAVASTASIMVNRRRTI